MSTRGTKPTPDAVKLLRGSFQHAQAHPPTVPVLEGEVKRPSWVRGRVLRIWLEKVAVYERRGQSLVGCEGALAQYCALEADLISRWKRKVDVPVALINAHRIYASEFYDTPASQHVAGVKPNAGNRFAGNGRPPADAAAQ